MARQSNNPKKRKRKAMSKRALDDLRTSDTEIESVYGKQATERWMQSVLASTKPQNRKQPSARGFARFIKFVSTIVIGMKKGAK